VAGLTRRMWVLQDGCTERMAGRNGVCLLRGCTSSRSTAAFLLLRTGAGWGPGNYVMTYDMHRRPAPPRSAPQRLLDYIKPDFVHIMQVSRVRGGVRVCGEVGGARLEDAGMSLQRRCLDAAEASHV
jgi:hypothetical protein